jgi:hypothetical protein
MSSKSDEQYSEKETERRFKKALQGAFSTPAKPLKSLKETSAPNAGKKKPAKRRATISR